jgi:hypothetical protein
MKPVLSYCTARAFSMGLLPMAHMSPPQAVAENDNDKLLPLPGEGLASRERIRRPHTAIPVSEHPPSCMDNARQRSLYRTLRGMKRLPVVLQRPR